MFFHHDTWGWDCGSFAFRARWWQASMPRTFTEWGGRIRFVLAGPFELSWRVR